MTAPIIVPIVGDTAGLETSLGSAQSSISKFAGIAKGLVLGIGTAFVARGAADFLGDAVDAFETLNDANDKLQVKLGDSADSVIALEEKMSDIGLSNVEVGTLAGIITDLGLAAGLSAPQVATLIDPTLRAGAALAAIDPTHTLSVADAVTAIAKAASGDKGATAALRALGLHLDTAADATGALTTNGLTLPGQIDDTARASGRWNDILADLNPAVKEQADGVKSLGDKQNTLNAKWETFLSKVGGPISAVFSAVLDVVLKITDNLGIIVDTITVDVPKALGLLSGVFDRTLGQVFRDIGRVIDTILANIQRMIDSLPKIQFPSLPFGIGGGGGPGVHEGDSYVYNLNTAADPSAVVRALRAWARDNGGREAVFKGV